MVRVNKRPRIPNGQPKMDDPEKLAKHDTQKDEKQNITQHVLDITIRKQTQITSNN